MPTWSMFIPSRRTQITLALALHLGAIAAAAVAFGAVPPEWIEWLSQ
jgi:hypothetical protein